MTDIQKENKSGGKVPNRGKSNIPRLRFPWFERGWETKKLGEVCEIKTGNKDTQNKVEDGKYPFFVRSNTVERIDSYSFDGEAILTSGDGVGVGKNFHYINGKFDFHQRVYALRNFKEGYSSKYIYHLFSEKFYDRVRKLSAKNSVDSVRMDMISEMKVYFPLLIEQQKISSFLSLIDERIQTQSKILLHYQSLIENITDQLAEQRIKLNTKFPNWKRVTLAELGKTFNGLSGKTKEDFGDGKKYIQYKQIFDSSKITIENCGHVRVSENENQNGVQFGDIFFTISSETPDEIGMSSVLLEEVKNVYLNSFCFGFRLNSFNKLLPEFARFLFRSKIVRNEIKKLAQGSTRYNMSKAELLKLKIALPSIKEQKKISLFLSALDQKIQTEKAILEQLEMQKKYLLKQMFA